MTKIASIDRRKVFSLLVAGVMAIATVLTMVAPRATMGADNPSDNEGTVEGGFSLNNGAPTVNSVGLYAHDNTTAATSMDPTVEYIAKVSVTDPNTLADLDSLYVTVYYDEDGTFAVGEVPAAGTSDNGVILKWDAVDTWTIDDDSSTWDIEVDSEDPASLGAQNTFTFCFHFTVGEVARESSHDSGDDAEWMIYAEATDLGGPTSADNHLETLEMNWYGKISVIVDGGGNVDFGTRTLGDTDQPCSNTVTATYTSNGPYDESVKADATWTGSSMNASLSNDGTADSGEIILRADDDQTLGGAVQVLSSGYTTIDDTSSITSESGDDVTMKLWITIASEGIDNESFTGTIFYQISNGA